jgi:hypothetical protein
MVLCSHPAAGRRRSRPMDVFEQNIQCASIANPNPWNQTLFPAGGETANPRVAIKAAWFQKSKANDLS